MTNRPILSIIKVALLIIVIWVALLVSIPLLSSNTDTTLQLSNTIDIINSIFTALAFGLLIYSSIMQKEELELQRKELELTRDELAKTAASQSKLVELTSLQVKIQRMARLAEIKPRLLFHKLEDDKLNDNFFFSLVLKVSQNQLTIKSVDFRYIENHLDPETDSKENEYTVDSLFTIYLSLTSGAVFDLFNAQVTIRFFNVDRDEYSQTFIFQDGLMRESDPQFV